MTSGLIGVIDGGGTGFKPGLYDPKTQTIVETMTPIPTPKVDPSHENFLALLRPALDWFVARDVVAIGLLAPPVLSYRKTDGSLAELPYGVHHPDITRKISGLDGMTDGACYFYAGYAVDIPAMTDLHNPFDLRGAIEGATGITTIAAKDTVGNLLAESRVGCSPLLGWDTFVMVICGSGFGIGAVRNGELVPRPETFVVDQLGNSISVSILKRDIDDERTIQDQSSGPILRKMAGDLSRATDAYKKEVATYVAEKQAWALAKLDSSLGRNFVITGTPARLIGEALPRAMRKAFHENGVKDANVVLTPLGAQVGLIGAGEVAVSGLAILSE